MAEKESREDPLYVFWGLRDGSERKGICIQASQPSFDLSGLTNRYAKTELALES